MEKDHCNELQLTRGILAAAAMFLALPAMTPAQAQTFSADQREEIGNIIKDYLLTIPK